MRKALLKYVMALSLASFVTMSIAGSQVSYPRGKRMKLTEILTKLTKKYQVYFTYDKALVDDVQVKYANTGESFEEEMNMVLSNTNLKFKVFDSRFVIIYRNDPVGVESVREMLEQFKSISDVREPTFSNEETRALSLSLPDKLPMQVSAPTVFQVKGKVVGDKQEPLPGTSVVEKGKANGTVTDANGEFTISVENTSAILVFSFVGYIGRDVQVNGQSNMVVSLVPNDALLDVVVVTGYSTQKKSTITGAVTTIEPKILEDRPITSLAKGLQGAGAGFQVTRESGRPGDERLRFNIRGATSISNVDPLVILDGVTTDTQVLTSLNPGDVESFTILKDASAAAIYGSRAAGGVILITTKKGKAGKARLTFDAYKSFQRIRNKPDLAGVEDQLIYKRESEINAAGGDPTGVISAKWQQRIDLASQGVQFASTDPNDKMYDIILATTKAEDFALRKSMPQQNYSLSASGGAENVSYFTSIGYFDRMGMLINDKDGEKRFNGRFNLTARLSKYITLDAKTAYTNYKSWNPGGGSDTGDWDLYYGLFKEDYIEYPFFDAFGNPSNGRVTSRIYGRNFENTNNNNFEGAFSFSIGNFIPGLLIKGVLGQTYRHNRWEGYNAPFQTYNRAGKIASVPNDILSSKPSYATAEGINYINDNQALVTYDKTIGEKHSISVLAGYQFNRNYYDQTGLAANNMVSATIPSLRFFGPNTVLGSDNSVIKIGDNDTYRRAESTSSFFGYLNYVYNKKYIANFTLRRDESSKLAPGNRVQVFPSLSAGWNLHEEGWFGRSVPQVNVLKLRGSWGILGGSSTIGPYDWSKTYNRSVNNTPLIGERANDYYTEGAIPSTSLGWENIKTTNVGMDAGLLNNTLTLSLEYYWKTNKDMFINQNLPQILGTTPPKINAGELKTQGWELTVGYHNKIGRDFTLDARFNIFDSRNKLISLNQDYGVWGGEVGTLIGYPLRTMWGFVSDGYYDSQEELKGSPQTGVIDASGVPRFTNNNLGIGDVKYKDLNGDGVINTGAGTIESHGDLKNFGTSDPRYQFGANVNLTYKQFDFGLFVQGVLKRKFLPQSFVYGTDIGWVLKEKVSLDYYTPENTDALYPRPYSGGGWNFVGSDKWMMNGAYARIKNVQLGYSLSSKLTQKLRISRFRIYISGEDILTLSKLGPFKDMLDPEYRNNGRFSYPLFSTASAGLNIVF